MACELIPAYSPGARGRSERIFGTLQGRLPQGLRLAGITGMEAANRFLAEMFVPWIGQNLAHIMTGVVLTRVTDV